MRLPRKDKKKVRAILLCHTANPVFLNKRLNKTRWLSEKVYYNVWFQLFNMQDRRSANTIKPNQK